MDVVKIFNKRGMKTLVAYYRRKYSQSIKYASRQTKVEFLKTQVIFYKANKVKKVIPKSFLLYRKVKCNTLCLMII